MKASTKNRAHESWASTAEHEAFVESTLRETREPNVRSLASPASMRGIVQGLNVGIRIPWLAVLRAQDLLGTPVSHSLQHHASTELAGTSADFLDNCCCDQERACVPA